MDEKLQIMKEKVEKLNEAAKAYYQENREIMPNIEYDRLYDELLALEKETGIVLSNSPTVRVGYELLTHLPREYHGKPMLSLDKTKDVKSLVEWLGSKTGILSWKLDGLTIVLTYENGNLSKAVTRGNGEVGEVVTSNVRVFKNIPVSIGHKGTVVVRGEAVIGYSDFEKMNREILDVNAKYKNPRNLCSGSVRQLNNRITAERNVYFFAFSVVRADGVNFGNSRMEQMRWLKGQGFDVVEWKKVDSANLEETVNCFSRQAAFNDFPADGLVLSYDDIEYGQSLGVTAKFPRDSIAFKWQDETMETKLVTIEWSASRTGLINPIAVFEPVELEGTTVKRASVHNVSVLEALELGTGDTIEVYKANMIIPQISDNKTRSGPVKIPGNCPVCGGEARIRQESGIKFLYCVNDDCLAKQIKSLTHFVSRDAMGIDGLSEATIEKWVANGIIREYADIFHIGDHRDEIVEMEGFGEKSFNKLADSIQKSRKTSVVRFLYSLGIPNVGLSTSRLICGKMDFDWERIQGATYEQLIEINGIGPTMANDYVNFFSNPKNKTKINNLLKEIEFEKAEARETVLLLENVRFAVTGAVEQFKNRNDLKKAIEEAGGKVTDSVTANTDYLVNNDILSNSTKNRKARELGVPVITENQLLDWLNTGVKPV